MNRRKHYVEVESLDLSARGLQTIPETIFDVGVGGDDDDDGGGGCGNILNIHCHDCSLSFPFQPTLQSLCLAKNLLETLPPSISCLSRLTV